MTHRRLTFLVASALAMLVSAVAVGASQARPTADPIKIGSIAILTGPSAQIGLETARGAQFMVDYLNQRGGASDRSSSSSRPTTRTTRSSRCRARHS